MATWNERQSRPGWPGDSGWTSGKCRPGIYWHPGTVGSIDDVTYYNVLSCDKIGTVPLPGKLAHWPGPNPAFVATWSSRPASTTRPESLIRPEQVVWAFFTQASFLEISGRFAACRSMESAKVRTPGLLRLDRRPDPCRLACPSRRGVHLNAPSRREGHLNAPSRAMARAKKDDLEPRLRTSTAS